MDFVLLAIALLLILSAGAGLGLLLLPRDRQTHLIELLSLALLLGAAFVSAASFVLGFIVQHGWLRAAVTACCLALPAAALLKRRLSIHWVRPQRWQDWLLLVAVCAQILFVAWLAKLYVLGWDGLLNWESKARVAFLNGGVIPAAFFSDPTRAWTMQSYPLLIPLAESWLYGWLGRADQELVKALFVAFYAAGLGWLWLGCARLGAGRWRVWAALLLLPMMRVVFGWEGAPSGYADFPLAVYYLATMVYLIEYWQTGAGGALRVAAVLAGAMCWVKQEGALLWGCFLLLLAVGDLSWRGLRRLAWAALPGLMVLSGWRIFLHFHEPASGANFLPVSPATLWAHLDRALPIARAVLGELSNGRRWLLLWPLVLIAVLRLWLVRRPMPLRLLPGIVLLPLALYSGIYLFSAWGDYLLHLTSSFSRLLLQLSLVAVLLIVAALPARRGRTPSASPPEI